MQQVKNFSEMNELRKTCWADMVDVEGAEEEDVAGDGKGLQHPLCISYGSQGHPFSCGPACKYASKGKGCKDGANCDHCHLCKWKKPVSNATNTGRPTRSRGQNPRQRRGKKEGQ